MYTNKGEKRNISIKKLLEISKNYPKSHNVEFYIKDNYFLFLFILIPIVPKNLLQQFTHNDFQNHFLSEIFHILL